MRDVGGNMGNMNGKCVFLWRGCGGNVGGGLEKLQGFFFEYLLGFW